MAMTDTQIYFVCGLAACACIVLIGLVIVAAASFPDEFP